MCCVMFIRFVSTNKVYKETQKNKCVEFTIHTFFFLRLIEFYRLIFTHKPVFDCSCDYCMRCRFLRKTYIYVCVRILHVCILTGEKQHGKPTVSFCLYTSINARIQNYMYEFFFRYMISTIKPYERFLSYKQP